MYLLVSPVLSLIVKSKGCSKVFIDKHMWTLIGLSIFQKSLSPVLNTEQKYKSIPYIGTERKYDSLLHDSSLLTFSNLDSTKAVASFIDEVLTKKPSHASRNLYINNKNNL